MQPSSSFVSTLERARRDFQVPALAAVAVRADDFLDVDAAGVLKQGESRPVTQSSQFHLGSLTNAITATMLATLVEEKRLQWTSGPLDVFPEWTDSMHPAYREITLDDLFRHRAGLPAFKPAGAKEFAGFPQSASRADCARWVLRQAPVNQPGSAALDSNAGPCIAAAMAERITRQPWEELVRQRVFGPLGIRGGFGWPGASGPDEPWGHQPSRFGPRPVDPHSPYPLPDFFKPAGDIRMNLIDYGCFLRVHLTGLQGGDSLLRAATVQHLHTPVDGYGLGWGIGPMNGVPSSGHVGGGGSFLAVVSIWPSKDLAIAVAANLDSNRALDACNYSLKAIYSMYGS